MLIELALLSFLIVLFVVLERGPLRSRIYGPNRAFRMHDPSVLVRAVYDRDSGEECLIRGKSGMTYREAVERHWTFTQIPRDSAWYLIDEAGNDVSDSTLDSYDGLVYVTTREGQPH